MRSSEDLPNEIAHPLHRKTLARGDLGDRNAAIEEADDPHFALGPVQTRGSSHRGGPAAANKGAGRGFGGIGLPGFADRHENKHRTQCAVWQENVGFPESGPAPRGQRSRRQDRGSGQTRGRTQGHGPDRGRSRRLLPPPFDRIQNAAACRIPGIRCRTPMSARSCAANCAARTGRPKRSLPEGAISKSELNLFNRLQRHFRVARDPHTTFCFKSSSPYSYTCKISCSEVQHLLFYLQMELVFRVRLTSRLPDCERRKIPSLAYLKRISHRIYACHCLRLNVQK